MPIPKKGAPAKKSRPPKTAPSAGPTAHEKRLKNMREDILRLVRQKQKDEIPDLDVGDEADAATQTTERELLFELSDNERQTLDAVEAALRKITQGAYGLCESCREKIGAERLKAIPHARYCIKCQARFDTPRG
jgi:DnaK suppressor protein